jgi:hypothetical protein
MLKEKLRKEIYKIIDDAIYTEYQTYYPTEKDLKRNPNCRPGGARVILGKRTATRKIMELLKKEH